MTSFGGSSFDYPPSHQLFGPPVRFRDRRVSAIQARKVSPLALPFAKFRRLRCHWDASKPVLAKVLGSVCVCVCHMPLGICFAAVCEKRGVRRRGHAEASGTGLGLRMFKRSPRELLNSDLTCTLQRLLMW